MVRMCFRVNAMEDDLELGPLDLVENSFTLSFTPFQIVSVMVEFQ
jgi:hypothetical protein